MTVWVGCVSCFHCDEKPGYSIGLRCLLKSLVWDMNLFCLHWTGDGQIIKEGEK
jgi:hypothetical protein